MRSAPPPWSWPPQDDSTDWSPLQGRDVVLWPDTADRLTGSLTEIFARALEALGPVRSAWTVRYPPGSPPGWTLAQGFPPGIAQALLAAALPPPLPQASALGLQAPEPWPFPIDGAQLLDDLTRQLLRFISFTPAQALASALWAIHSHTLDYARAAPRLYVTSATPDSGKSTLSSIMSCWVPRPFPAAAMTEAAFALTIVGRPTILIDQADESVANSPSFQSRLNAGHKREHAFRVKAVQEKDGSGVKRWVASRLPLWAAVLISGIGDLKKTLMSRSVIIELQPKAAHDHREDWEDHKPELETYRRQIARWVHDHRAELAQAKPATPGLSNRARDIWRELLAVADLCGGPWPERARGTATAIWHGTARAGEDDIASRGVLLLRHIREIFRERDQASGFEVPVLASATTSAALTAREDWPWGDMAQRKGALSTHQLAALLKPFKLYPKQTWHNGMNQRGYRREDLEPLWQRFLR